MNQSTLKKKQTTASKGRELTRIPSLSQPAHPDPTAEMNKRWLKIIKRKVPAVDLVDISAEIFPYNSDKRQFAPEYSNSVYTTMLEQEYAIGDYLSNPNCSLNISTFARHQMVMLIE